MTDTSDRFKVLKLPIWAAGFVALCLFLSRSAEDVSPTPRMVIDAHAETLLINQGVELGTSELVAGKYSIGQIERNLRLRLKFDETPERKLEVAGGLYAIASAYQDQGQSPDAARLAQQAADLAPGSLLTARCWLLCGQAWAVTSPDLPLSIRYFERANMALLDRLNGHPDDAQVFPLRAKVLQQLSQTEARFARKDEAIEHLRELTDKTPVAQALTPGERLRAMVSLGQLLSQTGHNEEAARWLSRACEYGTSDAVPAAEALLALADSAREVALAPSASSYDALRKIWETQRFESLPEWFQVGDELTSAYFFHEPPQLADFELVVGKLLIALPLAIEAQPPETTLRSELESLYATNLLLAADAARSRADQSEVARLVKLFETTFHGRDVNFTSPLARPAVRMHRITEIYRSTMSGHAEQLRQIQTSDQTPPRL